MMAEALCVCWPPPPAWNRAASATFRTRWRAIPTPCVIYEQYRDDKALEAHRESEHFKKYAVDGLYQKMRERNVKIWLLSFRVLFSPTGERSVSDGSSVWR